LKAKTISITVFSAFIFLIFLFICLLCIPVLSASQHQGIGFLGIFLMLAMIPIILFILIKKNIKIYFVVFYLVYFFITSYINIVFSATLEDMIFAGNHTLDDIVTPFSFSLYIDISIILFLFQFPVIILCLIIKKIYNYNGAINLKYFLKNPLIYILISFDVLISAFIFWRIF
jgi:hypothetical protein